MGEQMEELRPTPRTTINRMRKRGVYDREVIHTILDRSIVCHVGFVADGTPRVLPTLHARIGDKVYIHGAATNHMLKTAARGAEICLTATLIDGLVMARSAFHHSVNYRSAVIFGTAREVTDREAKLAAMRALVEHIAPGRWDASRTPSPKEIGATSILELPINEASAKVRTGGPLDDEEDYALPHWAGVIPFRTEAKLPIPDSRLTQGIAIPRHISEYRAPDARDFGGAHDGAPFERTADGFLISSDATRLDFDVIHRFLATQSYWAEGIPREVVARAIANSLCFGIYRDAEQVGFARVVTDYATYAYLADVFIVESHRGRGLSKALMEAVVSHPHLQGLRRFTLGTLDAHGLYRKFGFAAPANPERMMERADPDIYKLGTGSAK
jgi:nitroimidazol reductase NimA-like FMN-containing flavoprotein (pyridoxamine 5'-phosphate oxidase superfamily)/GNAT superfamily N-acetyltransferase